MKVLMIDFDGKLPELALCKLSTFHKAQGDEVRLILYKKDAATTWKTIKDSGYKPDLMYISTLFTWHKQKVMSFMQLADCQVEVGGTGWDFTPVNGKWQGKSNDLPAEIEAMKPDYSLYTVADIYDRIKGGIGKKEGKLAKAQTIFDAGMGFTSRGCCHSCDFCLVSVKEGRFRQVAEIGDLLNSRSNVLILLDNNLTADPYCVDKLHEIRDRKLTVDISQGIDMRLLTPEMVEALSEVKHLRQLHYAGDLMTFEKQIYEGIKLLSRKIKPKNQMCFMLTGYNTEFEEDMYRFKRLREWGVRPYGMPFNKVYKSIRHHCFISWVNGMYYTVCEFKDFGPWVKAQNDPQISLF